MVVSQTHDIPTSEKWWIRA